MKFTSEHNGKKLTFSTWRDQGKTVVFVSLTGGRDSRGVLLPCDVADRLVDALDEMLDDLDAVAA